jgi:hypothetical protein
MGVSRAGSRASIDNMLSRGLGLSKKEVDSSQDFRSKESRDPNQVMDNPRLASRSEIFEDDEGVKIIKRCFYLAIGDDELTGDALSVVLSFNMFDEPSVTKRAEVRVKLTNIIVETCPDVLKSITQLIPEFTAMFRFKDLAKNKADAARKIELYAPLHIIMEECLSSTLNVASEAAIVAEVTKWLLHKQ